MYELRAEYESRVGVKSVHKLAHNRNHKYNARLRRKISTPSRLQRIINTTLPFHLGNLTFHFNLLDSVLSIPRFIFNFDLLDCQPPILNFPIVSFSATLCRVTLISRGTKSIFKSRKRLAAIRFTRDYEQK